MKIWKYASDSDENYQKYIDHQISTTHKKNSWVYLSPITIEHIFYYKGFAVQNILCHGTRAAGEQKYFQNRYPNAYIIGSEICDTAEDYPMTIRHDFNKPKTEWLGKFDVVYSNSLDHSITPRETLNVWKNQLNNTGTLFLEYSQSRSVHHPNDPLDASENDIINLIKDANMDIKAEFRDGVQARGVIWACEVMK